jgi:hypothetical protein
MKTNKAKPTSLSTNQSALYDAITSSHHSLRFICNHCGYGTSSVRNWIGGVYEPKKLAFENIMQSIKDLESEPPISINWKVKKGELAELKEKGLDNVEIAKIFKSSLMSIKHAIARHLKDAA